MPLHTISRSATALVIVLLAGCASDTHKAPVRIASQPTVVNECGRNPGGCIFKGHYEPDERAYAEQQAKLLNQAELARLRSLSF